MTREPFYTLWALLKQLLREAAEPGPPYPLTLDEWAHVQRLEEERMHLARMKHWQLEEALKEGWVDQH